MRHSFWRILALSVAMGVYNLLIIPFQIAEWTIKGYTTIDVWGMT